MTESFCRGLAAVAWLVALLVLLVAYALSWGSAQFAVFVWSCIALPLVAVTLWWFARTGVVITRWTVLRIAAAWVVLGAGFVGLDFVSKLELQGAIAHGQFEAILVATRLPFLVLPLSLTAWVWWRLARRQWR